MHIEHNFIIKDVVIDWEDCVQEVVMLLKVKKKKGVKQ